MKKNKIAFIANVLFVITIILAIYILSYNYLLSRNLPSGVCPLQKNKLLTYFTIISGVVSFILFIISDKKKGEWSMYTISLSGSSNFFKIGIVVFVVLIFVERLYRAKNSKKDMFSAIIVGIVGLILLVSFVILPKLNGIKIEEGILKSTFATGFTKVEITKEDIQDAFVIDWIKDSEFKPSRRTLGSSFGNYNEGRFKLNNGSKALVYTNKTQNLCIQLEDKYLLLGPDNFEEFVEDFSQNIFKITE